MATNTEESMEPSTSRQNTAEFPRSRDTDQSMPRCKSRSPPPFLTYVHRMETPEAGGDSQEDLVKQQKPSPGCLQAFTNCMKCKNESRKLIHSRGYRPSKPFPLIFCYTAVWIQFLIHYNSHPKLNTAYRVQTFKIDNLSLSFFFTSRTTAV